MRMRRLLEIACVTALVLARPAGADEVRVVRIGHAAPTSGWLARLGIENENAARLAVEALNRGAPRLGGQPLRYELVAVDDAGDASRARDAAQTLVAAGSVAVVGHLLSASSLAAAPVYAAAGVAQVSPSPTTNAFTRSGWATAFRMLPDDTRLLAVLARHVLEQPPWRRVAIVDDGSPWGHGLGEEFARVLSDRGAQVVGSWQADPSLADLRPLVTELQARAPDVVFFGGFDRQAGALLKQMRRQGLRARLVGGDAVCTPDLVSYWAAGMAFDDQVLCALPAGMAAMADGDGAALAEFAAAYRARFERAPEFYGAYAYDAVMVLGAAVQRAGSTAPADIVRALALTRAHAGLTGMIGFDARGDVVDAAASLFTYRDEQRVLLRTLR